MTPDTIQMTFHRPETTMVAVSDQWRFKPVKRWVWLQKAAWWFLGKTGALSLGYEPKTTYKQVVIDKRGVREAILAAIHEMEISMVRPAHVYIGPDEIRSLTLEMRDYAAFSFDIQMGYNREIFGLPVTVIPWMRGVLVVPQP